MKFSVIANFHFNSKCQMSDIHDMKTRSCPKAKPQLSEIEKL